MKGGSHQQVRFSNRHELKRVQSTNDTYVFQTTLFRFTKQYIEIAKIDGVNKYKETSIHILEQIKRTVASEYITQNCIIDKVFVQHQKIYLFIRIGKNCFFVEIVIPKTTLELNNVFSQVIRIQNPHILDKMMEKCVISYKMFFEEHDYSNGLVLILMKDQQNDVFALLKGTIKNDALQFNEDLFNSKDLRCQLMFNNVLFTRSHFAFIYTCGQIRVYQISKGASQYKQKDDLKLTIQREIRLKREINKSTEQRLVSTCQTHEFGYFLFVLNAGNSRYVLLRWKKDCEFSNMKQFTRYSLPNYFDNSDLTYLTCLAESQSRCVMILSQPRIYFLLELNTITLQAKVRLLQTDSHIAFFGLHNGLLCLFQRESYSQALFQVDPVSNNLKFSSSKHKIQEMLSRQQSVILKTSSELQRINQYGQKGNNRLSSSDHNMAVECLSQQQVQRQDSFNKNSFINPSPHQPLPSFPLTLLQNVNIPHIPDAISQSNPLNILSNHINLSQSNFSDSNGNFLSFNPNPMMNFQNDPSVAPTVDPAATPPVAPAGGYMSFGVPPPSPIQQAKEPAIEPVIQIPAFSRGFSFGDNKVNEKPVQPKQPPGRIESKRNLKSLQRLPLQISRYESEIYNQVKGIKEIGKQSQKYDVKEVFSNNRLKQKIISINTKFWFSSSQNSCNKTESDLQDQFQTSFQAITNSINRKIHQYGLNHRKKSKNPQLIQQLHRKNQKIVHKNIISFKLKLNRLNEEASKLLKSIQNLQQIWNIQSSDNKISKTL